MILQQTRQHTESRVVELVEAVAEREGVDPTTLPPLADVIDPDALERLLGSPAGSGDEGGIRVEFQYLGYRITVEPDRPVSIE